MQNETSKQYPCETLDKIPMEDKIIALREEDFTLPSAEELLDMADDILNGLPDAHQVTEVHDALLDAIVGTKDKMIYG